jgi:hypothetical protein
VLIDFGLLDFDLQGGTFRRAAEDLVAEFPGCFEARGSQALTHSALGVVREMKGVVAPEGAVVVPEVVVRVVRQNADGCSG